MGMILADANIIIYLLEGGQAIAELFDENLISISFITELELLSAKKYTKAQDEKINEIIQEFTIYEYNNFIKSSLYKLSAKI